jgi:hypothetical protein
MKILPFLKTETKLKYKYINKTTPSDIYIYFKLNKKTIKIHCVIVRYLYITHIMYITIPNNSCFLKELDFDN